MSIQDRLAIEAVIARYAFTYDGQDAEGFSSPFAEDGVFEVFVPGCSSSPVAGFNPGVGLKQIGGKARVFASRHYQSGTLFEELTSDSAKTRTMLLVTHQRLDEALPRLALTGLYHDLWRKAAAGWRFARRAAYVDRDPELSV